MTDKQKEKFNKLYDALKRISKVYETPNQLKRSCGNYYGLEYQEALEMAYENIQGEAKLAIKGIRRIK